MKNAYKIPPSGGCATVTSVLEIFLLVFQDFSEVTHRNVSIKHKFIQFFKMQFI